MVHKNPVFGPGDGVLLLNILMHLGNGSYLVFCLLIGYFKTILSNETPLVDGKVADNAIPIAY